MMMLTGEGFMLTELDPLFSQYHNNSGQALSPVVQDGIFSLSFYQVQAPGYLSCQLHYCMHAYGIIAVRRFVAD